MQRSIFVILTFSTLILISCNNRFEKEIENVEMKEMMSQTELNILEDHKKLMEFYEDIDQNVHQAIEQMEKDQLKLLVN